MPSHILVTGHEGYIGSVMAPYLQKSGYDVVGLDVGFFRECILTGADFSGSYHRFIDCLATELAQREAMRTEAAIEVVKQAFWSYFSRVLTVKLGQTYNAESPGAQRKLREWAGGMPGIKWLWRRVSSYRTGVEFEMSLPALLRDASPYHADFMPVYQAITASETTANRKQLRDSGPAQAVAKVPGGITS